MPKKKNYWFDKSPLDKNPSRPQDRKALELTLEVSKIYLEQGKPLPSSLAKVIISGIDDYFNDSAPWKYDRRGPPQKNKILYLAFLDVVTSHPDYEGNESLAASLELESIKDHKHELKAWKKSWESTTDFSQHDILTGWIREKKLSYSELIAELIQKKRD